MSTQHAETHKKKMMSQEAEKIWETEIPGWIQVSGEDAGDYLQSQFSQDIRQLGEGEAAYGLFLSLKGKVRADAFICGLDEEEFAVVSYHCPLQEIADLLDENVIADDVEFEVVHSGGSFVTINKENSKLPRKALMFPGRWMKQEHWDVILPEKGEIPENCQPLQELEQIRIQDGMIAVPQDLGPGELPQEGGLEDVAVSFDKGCFLGQEVMARLKAMGKVQRRIYKVQGEGNVPQCGDKLLCGEKEAGELRSVVAGNEDNIWNGLALLRRKYVENEEAGDWKLASGRSLQIGEIC
jgi:folate-binding protein YgfZ